MALYYTRLARAPRKEKSIPETCRLIRHSVYPCTFHSPSYAIPPSYLSRKKSSTLLFNSLPSIRLKRIKIEIVVEDFRCSRTKFFRDDSKRGAFSQSAQPRFNSTRRHGNNSGPVSDAIWGWFNAHCTTVRTLDLWGSLSCNRNTGSGPCQASQLPLCHNNFYGRIFLQLTNEGRKRERGEQQRDKILGSTCALLYRSGAVLEFLHFISSSFNGVPQRSFYSVLLRPSDPGLPPLRNKKIAEIKSYPNPPSHLCAPEIRTRPLEFQGFVDDFDSNFSCKEKI